jgi:AmmeMemoRadiSam system protein B
MSNNGHLAPERVRPMAVAGRFYPADADELAGAVAEHLARGAAAPRGQVIAVMVPHAGYVYSGDVAGQVFANIDVPEAVIVLCPNHTGRGARISIAAASAFAMPGGTVPIDAELAAALRAELPGAEMDDDAHRHEHAIEVELPFLHARQERVRIVPLVLGGLSEAEAIELGRGLWRAAKRSKARPLVVASSDMSHYLPDAEARRVDQVALAPLLALDPGGLYRTVYQRQISMCGYIPATAMLAYAREAGAYRPELVGYATSGDAFGDRERVVGYAGVVVS